VADDRFLPVEPEPSREPELPPEPEVSREPGLSLLGSSLAGDWGRPGEPGAEVEIDPADPLGTAAAGRATADRLEETHRSNGSVAPRGDGGADAAGDGGAREADPLPRDDASAAVSARRETEPGASPRGPGAPQGHGTGGREETPGGGCEPEPRVAPPGFDLEDLDDELPLTLAGLLAEYHLPDVPPAPPRNGTPRTDVAVPSARRHVSGSMPVPAADTRFTPRPADAPDRPTPGRSRPDPADVTTQGPPRRGENGARLADLLAEAMDAFRHTGPGEATTRGPGDGAARGPGVGSRRG
jgi:hypothetical protein